MDQTEEAIRQTQQMQQMSEVMFQQYVSQIQVETGHVEDQQMNGNAKEKAEYT